MGGFCLVYTYSRGVLKINLKYMTVTKHKLSVMIAALFFVALFTVAVSVSAQGSHAKATGDVTWASGPGVEGYRTVFDAHVGAPGKHSERGSVVLYHPDGGMRAMDVSCAMIEGNEAWFAGEVYAADGAFDGQIGKKVIFWVQDNGQPGSDPADKIGATKQFANPCAKLGDWTGGGTVTDGNLKVQEVEEEV